MKIKSIGFYRAKIQLKQVFTTSLGSRDHNTNVFVKIEADNGLVGWGECSPNPKITGETADTGMIVGQMLAKALLNTDPSQHDIIMQRMDQVIFGHTGIKSAIDIACYDLAAKAKDQPLYTYLGGSIEKKIYTDYTVSVGSIEQMVADALKIKSQGFPAIKIKLGDGKVDDVQRVAAIRKAVGTSIDLRVDANQGWTLKQAVNVLNELSKLGVQYCEEPIFRKKYYQLQKVRKESKTKIMADECLFDHHDAKALINGGHCDMFNIKLGKSSGLFKAQKIIKAAEKKKMDIQIGCFMESRLGITASCHLALSGHLIKYFDMDSPLFHQIDPILGGIAYEKDWQIKLPDEAGLGLMIDDVFLKSCEQITIQ